jgi:DNA polymerase I
MNIRGIEFQEIWFVDFEFNAKPGNRSRPLCLVAKEFITGQTLRLWDEELRSLSTPPYSVSRESLFVAYYASAEFSCHLALNWPLPANVLDLFVEFRNHTNGLPLQCGKGLIGALTHFGFDSLAASEKEAMRQLVLRGGPFNENEKMAILDYCESDVEALIKLFPRMLEFIDVPRALLRGRYMKAAAEIECQGIPIDTEMLLSLRQYWPDILSELIRTVDAGYGVFDGTTFKADRWEAWLCKHGKNWPRLDTGRLALDEKTFSSEAKKDPIIAPIHELRATLSQMRLEDLAVGEGGRNRCMLSAFSAKTGRNQPSNSRFAFGPAVWLRGLIRPELGSGLAYIDWEQQEFGIAAALSGDPAMITAHNSGDPYIAFAHQCGAIPGDGTKETHGAIREQFKQCALAVQYGMEAQSLALRIGQSEAQARHLLRLHRETYPQFWRWSDGALAFAILHGALWTVYGWTIHIGENFNPRALRNFPMQANGAEMLRLACCLAIERGVKICAPIHDAILIEAPIPELDFAVDQASAAMADASAAVLGGFKLRTEAKVVRYPDRYQDARGKQMWQTVCGILERLMGDKGGPESVALASPDNSFSFRYGPYTGL